MFRSCRFPYIKNFRFNDERLQKDSSAKREQRTREASPGQAGGFPGSGSTATTSLLGHFSPSGEPAQRLVPKTRSLGGISAQPTATRFSRARGDVGSRAGWRGPVVDVWWSWSSRHTLCPLARAGAPIMPLRPTPPPPYFYYSELGWFPNLQPEFWCQTADSRSVLSSRSSFSETLKHHKFWPRKIWPRKRAKPPRYVRTQV